MQCATDKVRLSEREAQVAQLVAAGLKRREIALRLDIGEDTVKAHLGRMFAGLGAKGQVELALWIDQHPEALSGAWTVRTIRRPPMPAVYSFSRLPDHRAA